MGRRHDLACLDVARRFQYWTVMTRSLAPAEKRLRHDSVSGRPGFDSMGSGLVRADLGAILAIVAICALFSGPIVGTLALVLFIAASGALMMSQPFKTGRDLLRYSPFLLIPVLALLSTAWSDAPERTSRAALQVLVTMAACIAIANTLSARAMILTLFIISGVTCIVTLPYVPEVLATGMPLHGPFETKNPMGFAMVLALGLSLIVMVDREQPVAARIAAIPVMGVAAFLLVLAKSGNAVVGSAIILGATGGFLIARHVSIYARIGVVLFLFALAGVAVVFLSELQVVAVDFVENVLKKDMTFTGRTFIWDVASGLIAERPGFGHGYYAFWRHGNVEAEALWREFGISRRSGFTFHSAFVEMAVDLGLVGLGILLALCIGTAIMVFYRFIVQPTLPNAFFFALLIVIYLRSYTETGIIGPFSVYTALWMWASLYAMRPSSPGDRQ
jgi:exopolysaccharide production protein ExoQ